MYMTQQMKQQKAHNDYLAAEYIRINMLGGKHNVRINY